MKIIIKISLLILFTQSIIVGFTNYSYSINIENESNSTSTCNKSVENEYNIISCKGETNSETFKIKNKSTEKWTNYFTKKTYFNAEKTEKKITLKGKNKDKEFFKEYELKDLSWIQSPAFQLSEFIFSDKNNIEFLMITGPMFTKMTLKKEFEETVNINNTNYLSIKTRMSPSGFLGKFWKADIWYDKKTGYMIKYIAPIGPPGSNKITMELI